MHSFDFIKNNDIPIPINVQGEFFLKNNKRADPNKAVQGGFFLKINKLACKTHVYSAH